MADYIIETFDISKTYKLKNHKTIRALKDVNLRIKEGETFGLLGPNGAGKTTIVQILTTLMQPTSGYAVIDGYNILKSPVAIKKRIGLMLGAGMIYFRITGYNNLKFFCKIYNIKDYDEKIHSVAKELDLDNWLNQYVEKYSVGMKLKLALCRVLLIEAPILFLDEPTLGLDVLTTLFFIEKLKKLNKTIFLTSHNMHVVEKLCHRIAFVNKGYILKVGTQEEFKDLVKSEIKIDIGIIENKNQLKDELNQQNFIIQTVDSDKGIVITISDNKYFSDLFSVLSNYPSISKINELETSLEDLFTILAK